VEVFPCFRLFGAQYFEILFILGLGVPLDLLGRSFEAFGLRLPRVQLLFQAPTQHVKQPDEGIQACHGEIAVVARKDRRVLKMAGGAPGAVWLLAPDADSDESAQSRPNNRASVAGHSVAAWRRSPPGDSGD